MKFAKYSALLLLLTAMFSSVAQAGCGDTCCCMCGKKVCVLEVSQEKEDVTCFKVEAKEICIPGICLPWDKCGKRKCGGVRTVCVLSEDKREKTVCKYDWSIKTICTTCCKRHGFKHRNRCAQTNQDDKVPFEYYVADLDQTTLASAEEPIAGLIESIPDQALVATAAAEESASTPEKASIVKRATALFLGK